MTTRRRHLIALLPNLLLVVMAGLAFVVSSAPASITPPNVTTTLDKPANVPTWTADLAAQFPGCHANDGTAADVLVVVDSGADASRVAFDRAWATNHNANHDDNVWVVGAC